MKLPGPDHPITVTPNPHRVRVRFAGTIIADSTRALTLKETTYPPVQYIPREDVEMTLLTRTENHTYCPYKGDASYYTVTARGHTSVNAAWSYEQPYPSMTQIREYLAFYPDRVESIEEE